MHPLSFFMLLMNVYKFFGFFLSDVVICLSTIIFPMLFQYALRHSLQLFEYLGLIHYQSKFTDYPKKWYFPQCFWLLSYLSYLGKLNSYFNIHCDEQWLCTTTFIMCLCSYEVNDCYSSTLVNLTFNIKQQGSY